MTPRNSRAITYSAECAPSSGGANVDRNESARSRFHGGRKRRARSLGRYPFLAYAEQYLERREVSLAKSSLEELGRKARYLNRMLADLKKSKRISSASPRKMTEADIRTIIKWMDEQGHENSYKAKNLGFIKDICQFAGNNVFTEMKADGIELPKKTPKELNPMTEDELKTVLDMSEELNGWSGEVTRFLVWMYPYSGLRASELRQAHLEDLDPRKWTIWVRHPKGEMRYARQRTAPILPPARKAVLRYLEARKARLAKLGIESDILIPNYNGKGYSSTGFRRMKAALERKVNLNLNANLEFKIKDFRAVFCQQNIDRGVPTEAVAVAMGHSSTKTTETFYGRMRTQQALDQLNAVWSTDGTKQAPETMPKTPQKTDLYQKPLIERKFDNTGYA